MARGRWILHRTNYDMGVNNLRQLVNYIDFLRPGFNH